MLYKNTYTEFHKNLAHGLVTDGWTDVVGIYGFF
jgi:hypothetical protein